MPLRPGKRLIDTVNQHLMQSIVLNPVDTGYITDRVAAVRTDTANFYIFRQDGHIVCFDTGYRRRVIRSELQRLGIRPSEVTHVFLTHADIDHVQGLGLLKNASLYLSAAEERMFRGLRPPRRAVRTPRIRRPYNLLRDGDVVRIGTSTVQAIETPGHTPGSMSFLLDGAYLFTGDTCKFADGVAYAGSRYTMDMETQRASIKKLAGLCGVRYVLTAHSGYTEDFETAFGCWR